MKNCLLLSAALLLSSLSAGAVATNHALSLSKGSSVYCGNIESMASKSSYAIQLWANADSWTPGDVILSLGNTHLTLANPGFLNWGDLSISSDQFAAGKWFQLTILCDAGNYTVLVNGDEAATAQADNLIGNDATLTIGGSFDGRIDELRLWNAVPDAAQFNWFINNTVNRWNPFLDNLAAYYKFDQTQCKDIVEQTAVWNPTEKTNHGSITGNAVKEPVTDNPVMKYRVNGAYTANARFYDRAIPRDQYLLSNDLIILGIQSYNDGHLEYLTPNNHGTLQGDAKQIAEYEGRQGVLSVDGNGWFECGEGILKPYPANYYVELNMYIDKWVEGATILDKSEDGLGLTVALGNEETHSLCIFADGHKYQANKILDTGKWIHLALLPKKDARLGFESFKLYVDFTWETLSKKDSDEEIFNKPTAVASSLTVGKGFVGKIDNMMVWEATTPTSNDFKAHAEGNLPMPGFDKVVTATVLKDKTQACYLFDKEENPGFNSFSQDNWRDIMCAAYEGHDGWECRISVQSHSGWESTIANAEKRKIFAEDLARLSEGYDGVELDLEWIYGTQTDLGKLAEEIRKALPEEKSFMISCHNVAYMFPKDKMDFVDGFTFQQYGPQNIHSQWDKFEAMCETFEDYGFPKEKIIGSYATTTSKGYKDGTAAVAISGVRSGFLDDYEPSDDMDSKTVGDYTYYFTSPIQVYRRANHVTENNLGGIFYWDMGNDVPVAHRYNFAKWASYGLNSNVEPVVKEVVASQPSGVGALNVETVRPIVYQNGELRADGEILLYAADGKQVARGLDTLSTAGLLPGIYTAVSGQAKPLKIIVRK